jgi:hypothetical protein
MTQESRVGSSPLQTANYRNEFCSEKAVQMEWIASFAALVTVLGGSTGFLDPTTEVTKKAADRVIPLIVIDDVPLTDAIRNLAREAEINIIFDPRVPGSSMGAGAWKKEPNVSARWEQITASVALLELLEKQKLMMVTNSVTGVARIGPLGAKISPVQPNQLSGRSNPIVPLTVMEDVSLADSINYTAKSAGWRVIFDDPLSTPEFEGTVSVRWENITAVQAVTALLDNYWLEMSVDERNQAIRIHRKRS